MEKSQLSGSLEGPSGQAPAEAWSSVGGEIHRPQDVWIVGRPSGLLSDPAEWRRKLLERWQPPKGPLGLRLRFVVVERDQMETDLLGMVGAVLETLTEAEEELFLHAELMMGPEEGLYLAYDNRPPALLTQVWLAGRDQPPSGELPAIAVGPLHWNLVVHDSHIGFREMWHDGTLEYALERLVGLCAFPLRREDIHQVTVARSDGQTGGLSIGIEGRLREDGSHGGATAADLASRAHLPTEAMGEGA